ncbi:MAG TPA: acyl-CoA ligase (AMP-forming), exosortase A system-associated [Alphaproteobacteria bacterium]|nr:acyl-CoA ligase (AMP-forming), exosortase A system-associated [Alphaproteobacteria bacterium]
MTDLLHDLIDASAERHQDRPALSYKAEALSYRALAAGVDRVAAALAASGLAAGDRVAILLEKRPETVLAIFGAAAAGGVFVPLNPLLKPRQVGYILRDCNVRTLVTSASRAAALEEELARCPDLKAIITVDGAAKAPAAGIRTASWEAFLEAGEGRQGRRRRIDTDMAAILYTSGSTGSPKGVVLSHRNMVAGARSVSRYLENHAEDRILSVLPLSFDAGFSQLTTAFAVGAEVVLMNYLLPRDVVRACAGQRITGLTCVAPLWVQLAQQDWPAEAAESLRYFANTGGHMPRPTLDRLRRALPNARPYLMYGLTEAFRSTYLDPAEVDRRPDSIGKAIPNAEILVVRPDGSPCAAGEPGELVHRGALVSLGYWNDPERTAERFRPAPGQPAGLPIPEMAVWSGDIVRTDGDGFLYFVGRRDEMIKTSGYRVSPTEVEDVIYASGLVAEAAAIGVPHPTLGQAVVVVAAGAEGRPLDTEAVVQACRRDLPLYMVPARVIERAPLPRNPNGKIDRKLLAGEYAAILEEATA